MHDAECTIELCHFEEIADGAARGFDPFGDGRDALFVVRRGDSLSAYRNECPHQGASLPWRNNAYLDATGTNIVCSAHGAKFDIENGACVSGPALGRSLESVPVFVSDDGKVKVTWSPGKSTGRCSSLGCDC